MMSCWSFMPPVLTQKPSWNWLSITICSMNEGASLWLVPKAIYFLLFLNPHSVMVAELVQDTWIPLWKSQFFWHVHYKRWCLAPIITGLYECCPALSCHHVRYQPGVVRLKTGAGWGQRWGQPSRSCQISAGVRWRSDGRSKSRN